MPHKDRRHKLNISKSKKYMSTFLHTRSEQSKNEIKKAVSFVVASKRTKHLGINLTRTVKELYTENLKHY